MAFYDIVDQTIALLQQHKRLSYRALRRHFHLDDTTLSDLKFELITVQELAIDQNDTILLWREGAIAPTLSEPESAEPVSPMSMTPSQEVTALTVEPPEAERRQLTVLFCDLVGSTALSAALDPEELRDVLRAYQAVCAEIMQRFGGVVARQVGDGLLIYFGYPQTYDDAAARAARAGLALLEALPALNAGLHARMAGLETQSLQIRLGLHTGLVVVGALGEGTYHDPMAVVGEAPNVAARLQDLAAPNTLVVSAATQRLLGHTFLYEDYGLHTIKGIAAPVHVYRVRGESEEYARLAGPETAGLSPLVAREQEVELLLRLWGQAKQGRGRVLLLSGEAGIGKSRLVQSMKEHIRGELHTRWECRCSPYYQHSTLYPVLDLLQRTLRFQRDDTPECKLQKFHEALAPYAQTLAAGVTPLAALLSLPLPAHDPWYTLTPERQKQHILEALVSIFLALAAQQPLLLIIEDLHWIDPSTLAWLDLLMEQVPTARLLLLLTSRPEFVPPWSPRAYLTQLTLRRLPHAQVEALVAAVAGGKRLPDEVRAHIVARTDGVPLFVEELTKMVLESGWLQEHSDHYALIGPLPALAIPMTLHDSLMARLDRLATVKIVAQLGAALGRAFSYALLQAVSPLDEAPLQQALAQLVEAELLYQRGRPPLATYLFKHALIQDTAYQSLLKSTRQQFHLRIARVLEARFTDIAETEPEVLAHHYTEAGLLEHAISFWQRAGRQAARRSAHLEAIAHFTRGLELLAALPETPERDQHELTLQMALGASLLVTQGSAAPEVEQAYTRALALCRQEAQPEQLARILFALWGSHQSRAEHVQARQCGEELLALAHRLANPTTLLVAQYVLGTTLYWLGEPVLAREHLERALALDTPQPQSRRAEAPALAARVATYGSTALTLWVLGYPEQARQCMAQGLTLTHTVLQPFSQAGLLLHAALLHLFRREVATTAQYTEAELALALEHGFAYWAAGGVIFRGWVLAVQGQPAEGIAQMRQGLMAWQATGSTAVLPTFLPLLAEVLIQDGQYAEAQSLLGEVQDMVQRSGERAWEAEVYRLQGELRLLQDAADTSQATACFCQALAIARRQRAKSLELRAALSLSRLWQRQGKRHEARQMLSALYAWFGEGWDTGDMQEARALLQALA
jgi:class 3 adenylate cyclase/predicted ATPase